MSQQKKELLCIAAIIAIGLFLVQGCATTGEVKKQMLSDLNAIIRAGDCPTTCELLKGYVAAQTR